MSEDERGSSDTAQGTIHVGGTERERRGRQVHRWQRKRKLFRSRTEERIFDLEKVKRVRDTCESRRETRKNGQVRH